MNSHNLASLDLCRELYELSGWGDETHTRRGTTIEWDGRGTPLYDLGYLLRKLPEGTVLSRSVTGGYTAIASGKGRRSVSPYRADTPENVLCMLAIELFKQGVL